MTALPKRSFTPEEYLALEVTADYKSQYVAGEIFAMTGGQPEHVAITWNLVSMLHGQFRGRPCTAYFADMRVDIREGDLYTYPDVSALCGEPKFDRTHNPPSLLNPQVIFEVLSPSTEVFDRGDKFTRYRRLETLTDYVLISTERMRVEHHHLQANGVWACEEHDQAGHLLTLASVDCALPLAEIYERVNLPASRGAGTQG